MIITLLHYHMKL